MKISLLLIFLTVCGWGQSSSVRTEGSNRLLTDGFSNGRAWNAMAVNNKLTIDEKLEFLMGFREAASVVIITVVKPELYDEVFKDFWPSSLTNREIIDALNRFYDTPENRPISIANALTVVAKRAAGVDETTIQKLIEDLRADTGK
jgi:hypothetical protein